LVQIERWTSPFTILSLVRVKNMRIRAVWSRSMLFNISFSTWYRVCKRTAWILIRLRGCAGWSDPCWSQTHNVGFFVMRLNYFCLWQYWKEFSAKSYDEDSHITTDCSLKAHYASEMLSFLFLKNFIFGLLLVSKEILICHIGELS
jgi:hypothetical protein